jgi:hypothetical protein
MNLPGPVGEQPIHAVTMPNSLSIGHSFATSCALPASGAPPAPSPPCEANVTQYYFQGIRVQET